MQRVRTADALSGAERVGLYFGGKASQNFRTVTTLLKPWYEQYKKLDGGFEVIFISADTTEEEGNNHFKEEHGNWLMLPYSRESYQRLAKDFQVTDNPTLIFC